MTFSKLQYYLQYSTHIGRDITNKLWDILFLCQTHSYKMTSKDEPGKIVYSFCQQIPWIDQHHQFIDCTKYLMAVRRSKASIYIIFTWLTLFEQNMCERFKSQEGVDHIQWDTFMHWLLRSGWLNKTVLYITQDAAI